MKKMKAILSVFLCLLMLWACFAPAAAIDADGGKATVAAKAPRLLDGDNTEEDQDPELNWDIIFAAVETAAETLFFTAETEVDVSGLNIPNTEENQAKIADFVAKTPQLLCIEGLTFIFTTDVGEGETSYIIKLKYEGDAATVAANVAKRQACEDVMFRLMRGLEDMSDYDKCLLLHDRLAAWVEYDQANYEAGTIPRDSYSAYGALVSRIAVCRGYSMAYSWMLKKLGIASSYETSASLEHGWTKVILDDTPYYVDVTYDDPTRDVPGRMVHDNFLVSFETFKANHNNATDYDQTVTDTTYDDSFDKSSSSEIVRLNGNYYYLKDNEVDGNPQNATLVRRGSNDSEYTFLTVNTGTYSNQTHETAAQKGDNWVYHPKMTAIGNKILFTDGKTLYAFDVKNPGDAPVAVFTLENSESILNGLTDAQKSEFLLQGLKQIDGKLYLTAFNDERFDVDTVEKYTIELDYCPHEAATQIGAKDPADCTEIGYIKYICEDCRKVWTENTVAGEHNLVLEETVPANCASPEIEKYKCSNTGCSYTETKTVGEVNPNNHVPGKAVNHPGTPSTCKTQGYSDGVFCTACNKYIEGHTLLDVDSNNHENTVVTKEAFPATCEKDGWTQEVTCLACNNVVSPSVPIGKKGHAFTETVVPPTCTTRGYTLHWCPGCFQEYKDNFVDPTGHPEDQCIEVAATEGSCVADAYEAGIYCQACNTYIYGHYPLGKNKNNHVGPWQENCSAAATCTVDGYTGAKKCTACGFVDTSEATIQKAPGHTWNDGVVMKEPNCTDKGIRKFTCTVCSATYVEEIKKLGHIDENGDEFCDRCDKNLNENACPYCNKVHTGVFAPVVKFFHKIFYLLFGAKKAK